MTRREALDAENMLKRLTDLLYSKAKPVPKFDVDIFHTARADAESLRRISMTLHRWHELECGTDAGAIERVYNEDGTEGRPHWRQAYAGKLSRHPVPDREKGALARLAKVMARYPSLKAYVQTDPRGCSLYILRPGDVPEGADVSAYYSRGVAVHQ